MSKPEQVLTLKRRALVAERRADEAAASDLPWAIGNLRLYQNLASKFWGEYYAALEGFHMTATYHEIARVAAVVYDQDTHSDADMAFLQALHLADKDWHATVDAANIQWGGGSQMWQIVKALATRSRDAAYVKALAVLETADEVEA